MSFSPCVWTIVRQLAPLIERYPWQFDILEVIDDDHPPPGLTGEKLMDWSEAFAIGQALKEAAAKRE